MPDAPTLHASSGPRPNLKLVGSHLGNLADPTHVYRLRISPDKPDFRMIVMAAATAAQVIKDLFRNTERHDRSK